MSEPAQNKPPVAIVLCTHNGAQWVSDQVQSLAEQTWPVDIHLFDDASTDDTVAAAKKAFAKVGKRQTNLHCVVRSELFGVVKNFAEGIQHVLQRDYEYIALCDQDDIWQPDRVEAGMRCLLVAEDRSTQSKALLVHSDLQMVNAHNHVLHKSFLQWRGYRIDQEKPLATVLGQNGVMGNTILMNAALARSALPFPADLHVHDYWLAVVAEVLGERHFLPKPLVRYRIHGKNVSNSTKNVAFGSDRLWNSWSLGGIRSLDFRLPFKEDTRAGAIQALLHDARFTHISDEKRQIIAAFADYLLFRKSRWALVVSSLRHGFFRPGLGHKIRVVVGILTTRRYIKISRSKK